MASATKSRGGWKVEYRDERGAVKSKWLPVGTTQAEAHALRNELTAQERDLRRNGMTVAAYSRKWLAGREKIGIKDHLNEKQRMRDHILPVLGDIQLSKLRAYHLRDWALAKRSESEMAPRTLRNCYSVLKSMIRDARIDDLVAVDPCILTKAQLGKVRDKDLSWRAKAVCGKEVLALLMAHPGIPLDRQVFYAIAGLSGLRLGEICALRWSDIERKKPLHCIHVTRSHFDTTKTEEARAVPVHRELASRLAEWRLSGWESLVGRSPADADLIVPVERTRYTAAGVQRTKSMVDKRWAKDRDALELPPRLRFHDLRRTFISLSQGDGARRDVIERVTHKAKSERAIDLYTSVEWSVLCAEVSKLDVAGALRDITKAHESAN